MSVRIMAECWEHSQHAGTSLLVLLAIADFANDEGRIAWPSLQTLATKCRCSRRHVVTVLAQLEASGELFIERHVGRGHHNRYMVKRFHHLGEDSPKSVPSANGELQDGNGEVCAQMVNFDALNGEPQFTRTIKNHQLNHQLNQKGSSPKSKVAQPAPQADGPTLDEIGQHSRQTPGLHHSEEAEAFVMHLRCACGRGTWDSYYGHMRLLEISETRVVLVVATDRQAEWANHRLRRRLEDAAKAISAPGQEREVVVLSSEPLPTAMDVR